MRKNDAEEKKKWADVNMKKNILVVDDSALMRRVTSDIINADERFEVTDFAKNGFDALDMILSNHGKYAAVVLDINMPRMTGLEVLEQLAKSKINTKVIISSTVAVEGAKETIRALELGAFDFITKPTSYSGVRTSDFGEKIILKLECAALGLNDGDIKIDKKEFEKAISSVKDSQTSVKKEKGKKLIFIASSTGGPRSLQKVIPYIPKNIDAPIVLVQHMPKGFTKSLADRLDELSEIDVTEIRDGDVLKKGHVYIAPGGYHTTFSFGKDGKVRLNVVEGTSAGGLKPCCDVTLKSLEMSVFEEITCVVMTGMGHDATRGILDIRKSNNLHIISQNEETCVVYGMPKSIEKTGCVDEVLPLEKIAISIINHVGVQKNGR